MRSREVVPDGSAGPGPRRVDAGTWPGVSRWRLREPRVVAGVVGGLLVIGLLALWLVTRGAGDDRTAATAPPRQKTLLVQVTNADGAAVSNALVGVTAGGRRGTVVLIPSRLAVDVPDVGSLPLADAATRAAPRASARALQNTLHVRVDAVWMLTVGGLADLVDRVDGVQADVKSDVVATDAQGKKTILVRAGPQKLRGSPASVYATYLGPGEPEAARLSRLFEVLVAVVRQLPGDRAELAAHVAGLGGAASSTLAPHELEEMLMSFRRAASAGLVGDVLPVNEVVAAGDDPTYRLDTARAREMLRLRFAGALVSGAGT